MIATAVWCIHEFTVAKNAIIKIYREDTIIGGDKAYADDKLKKHYRSNGVFYGINDKAKRNHSLSDKQKILIGNYQVGK